MRPFLTLHDPATAKAYYEAGLWTDDTFYSLLSRHSTALPDAIALVDGRKSLSWKELQSRVDALAEKLLGFGLAAGDRVSMWMSNRMEAVV